MNSVGTPDYVIVGNGNTVPINTGSADVNGCFWWLFDDVGGWDSPDGRVTMLTKIGQGPSADGEYPSDQHYRGRSITMTLYAECPTEAAREAARYLLTGALDLVNSTGTFYVNERVPKWLPQISRSGNSNQGKLTYLEQGQTMPVAKTPPIEGLPTGQLAWLLKAEIEFYSPDPRKYAQTPQAATNYGSDPLTPIVFTPQGNTATTAANLTIENGGNQSRIGLMFNATTVMSLYTPTLPAGAPPLPPFPSILVLDSYNKLITNGDAPGPNYPGEPIGGDNYYYLRDLRTSWFDLAPGTQSLLVSTSGGTLPIYLLFFDAWI